MSKISYDIVLNVGDLSGTNLLNHTTQTHGSGSFIQTSKLTKLFMKRLVS